MSILKALYRWTLCDIVTLSPPTIDLPTEAAYRKLKHFDEYEVEDFRDSIQVWVISSAKTLGVTYQFDDSRFCGIAIVGKQESKRVFKHIDWILSPMAVDK